MESHYEVSSHGNVRRASDLALRKPQPTNRGYLTLKVRGEVPNVYKTRSVHSLVAEAFLGPKPDKHEVNHIDGNKQNNSAENLEWVTAARNMQHSYEIGLRKVAAATKASKKPKRHSSTPRAPFRPQGGAGNYNAKLTESQAAEILTRLRRREACTALAKEFGISKTLVIRIKDGSRWPHLPR
jgi:hypothetical protein